MKKTDYLGNTWIGMFAKTNNSHTIIPVDSTKKFEGDIEENLKTACVRTTVGDTNLAGAYICMNSTGIVLPNITAESERELIKKQTGLNTYICHENHNALGSNLAVNDKYGVINPHISSDEKKKLGDVLGIELFELKIAEYSTVGSSILLNNSGFLATFRSTEKEVENLGNMLHLKGARGTINFGTGFISLGALVNDNGYVVGNQTTAYEMGRIEEYLGFL